MKLHFLIVLLLLMASVIRCQHAEKDDTEDEDTEDDDAVVPSFEDDDDETPTPDETGPDPSTDDTDETTEEEVIEPLDYSTPMPRGFYYFAEPFLDTNGIGSKWHVSTAKKDGLDGDIAKYNGEWEIGLPQKIALKNDYGLIVKTKARHHAIASRLDQSVKFDCGKPLVVQYEVKYEMGQECGGGYIKLLSKCDETNLKGFHDKTPYTIMFGPDKCGMDSKVHFILRFENPKNHTIAEHHAKPTTKSLDDYFNDRKSHLYTLIINKDNSYKILVDQKEITSGSLLKDLEPALTPPKEIDDPDDTKPEDWDDRDKIVDPDAKKPDDWDETAPKEILDENAKEPDDWLEDEPDLVADSTAEKPQDWDTEMDGEWEAPKIKNPKCESISGCGKWTPPMIDNPAYKGKWKAPKITNPNYKGVWTPKRVENRDYFEPEPCKMMTSICAIGLELWTMSDNIVFDNFLLTDSKETAAVFAEDTWNVKTKQESRVISAGKGKDGLFQGLISAAEARPWLWVIYILTVLIPIVLIAVFCFGGTKDKVGVSKKRDVTEADVVVEEFEEQQEEDVDEGRDEGQKSSPARSKEKKGKAALEVEEDDDEDEEGVEEMDTDAKEVEEKTHDSPRRLRQRKQD